MSKILHLGDVGSFLLAYSSFGSCQKYLHEIRNVERVEQYRRCRFQIFCKFYFLGTVF